MFQLEKDHPEGKHNQIARDGVPIGLIFIRVGVAMEDYLIPLLRSVWRVRRCNTGSAHREGKTHGPQRQRRR